MTNKRVLVASKTCRTVMPENEMRILFLEHGMEPDFRFLCDSMGDLSEFDAVVIGTEYIGENELRLMKKVRVIEKFGVGTDNIDLRAAQKRNIEILNMPGINSECVAEMALSLMMSAARCITVSDRSVRSGSWPRIIGSSMCGKTLGIIGTGAIGRAVCSLVSGFHMDVLGFDPVENIEFTKLGGRYVPFHTLLENSDFISLHVPLLDSTRHLIGKSELSIIKENVVIINTARGGLIDEAALYEFLLKHGSARAGLDVLEHEPPLNSPLLSLSNVIITPHIAAYDDGTLRRMLTMCINNLEAFFNKLG
ncbi:MAG: phosphoglycerate dehydrogenase [Clostridia bacterium]|nr:phosphoglycerate dehydrogenase [Clostridia bacterium]